MANIPVTDIGTSRPASICKGKPMIPAMGSLKLGYDINYTIINREFKVLVVKAGINVGVNFFAGVCGPGWGVCMKVEGNTTGNNVTLTVTEDQLAAGLILGASAGMNIGITGKYYKFWKGKWITFLNLQTSFGLDIIKVAKLIYDKLTESKAKKPLEETNKPEDKEAIVKPDSPFGIQAYSISDFQEDSFAENDGDLAAFPKFPISINLWDSLVKLDKASAICSGAAIAADTSLKAARISLGFGPSFGLSFPVRVKMNEIYLDGTKYENLTFEGDPDNSQTTVTGTTTGTPPSDTSVSNVSVKFSESPGIDFYFGLFASLTVLEVFSISWEKGINLLDLFNVKPGLGPFYFDLPASAGATMKSYCEPCSINRGIREVVFE